MNEPKFFLNRDIYSLILLFSRSSSISITSARALCITASACCRLVTCPLLIIFSLASFCATISAYPPRRATFTSKDNFSRGDLSVPLGSRDDGLWPYLFATRSSISGPCPAKKLFHFFQPRHLEAELAYLPDEESEITGQIDQRYLIVRAVLISPEPDSGVLGVLDDSVLDRELA